MLVSKKRYVENFIKLISPYTNKYYIDLIRNNIDFIEELAKEAVRLDIGEEDVCNGELNLVIHNQMATNSIKTLEEAYTFLLENNISKIDSFNYDGANAIENEELDIIKVANHIKCYLMRDNTNYDGVLKVARQYETMGIIEEDCCSKEFLKVGYIKNSVYNDRTVYIRENLDSKDVIIFKKNVDGAIKVFFKRILSNNKYDIFNVSEFELTCINNQIKALKEEK